MVLTVSLKKKGNKTIQFNLRFHPPKRKLINVTIVRSYLHEIILTPESVDRSSLRLSSVRRETIISKVFSWHAAYAAAVTISLFPFFFCANQYNSGR
jgi:hypothetical protein